MTYDISILNLQVLYEWEVKGASVCYLAGADNAALCLTPDMGHVVSYSVVGSRSVWLIETWGMKGCSENIRRIR